MTEIGAPDHIIKRVTGETTTAPEVQPANEIIVSVFFTVCTQWRMGGMSGIRVGLDYSAVGQRIRHIKEYRALPKHLKDLVWDGLQRMELAAMAHWHSKDDVN